MFIHVTQNTLIYFPLLLITQGFNIEDMTSPGGKLRVEFCDRDLMATLISSSMLTVCSDNQPISTSTSTPIDQSHISIPSNIQYADTLAAYGINTNIGPSSSYPLYTPQTLFEQMYSKNLGYSVNESEIQKLMYVIKYICNNFTL